MEYKEATKELSRVIKRQKTISISRLKKITGPILRRNRELFETNKQLHGRIRRQRNQIRELLENKSEQS